MAEKRRTKAGNAAKRSSTKPRAAKTKGKAPARKSTAAARARSNGGSAGSSAEAKRASRSRSLSAIEAVQAVREHVPELLGRPLEGVLAVDRDHGRSIVPAQ